MSFKKNTAITGLTIGLVNATDGSAVTTGTPVGYVTLDGGVQTAIGDVTPIHEGNGQYSFDITAAEMNGDMVSLVFIDAASIPVHYAIKTVAKLTSELQDFNASTDTVANVTTVATTTTNTDMVAAPDNASITAILADTNELQLNQGNWLTAAGFNTVVPPTLAEFNARSIPSADYFVVTDYTTPLDASGIRTAVGLATANMDTQFVASTTATGFATTAEIADVPTVAEFNARTLPFADYFVVTDYTDDTATLAALQTAQNDLDVITAVDGVNLSSAGVDLIWDEDMTSHTTNGTFGKTIKGIAEGWSSAEGAVNDGAATSVSFVTDLTNIVSSFYSDQTLIFISGSLKGQGRVIQTYNGSTKTVTFDEAFSLTPSNTDQFLILTGHTHSISEIATAVTTDMDANSAQLSLIVDDTNELQTNQGNWVTATGFSTFDPTTDSVDVGKVLGSTLTETTLGRVAYNLSVFFDNSNVNTTKVVDDVGTAISGGGEFTTTEKNQIRYRLGLDGVVATPTASPDLSTFDETVDTVARVTLVDTTTDLTNGGGGTGLTAQETRDAMKLAPSVGVPATDSIDDKLDAIDLNAFDGDLSLLATAANLATIDGIVDTILLDTNELQVNQGAWATADVSALLTAAYFDTRSLLSADYFIVSDYLAPDNVSITAILADTNELQLNQGNWLTATGFSTFDPATDPVNLDKILGTALTETTSARIATNFSFFYDNSDANTTKVVGDVGSAVSGGGEFTTLEKNQLRYRLGLDGTVATPAATPDLSSFDPSTDTVARVTLVDTTTDLTNGGGGVTSPAVTQQAQILTLPQEVFQGDVTDSVYVRPDIDGPAEVIGVDWVCEVSVNDLSGAVLVAARTETIKSADNLYFNVKLTSAETASIVVDGLPIACTMIIQMTNTTLVPSYSKEKHVALIVSKAGIA